MKLKIYRSDNIIQNLNQIMRSGEYNQEQLDLNDE